MEIKVDQKKATSFKTSYDNKKKQHQTTAAKVTSELITHPTSTVSTGTVSTGTVYRELHNTPNRCDF